MVVFNVLLGLYGKRKKHWRKFDGLMFLWNQHKIIRVKNRKYSPQIISEKIKKKPFNQLKVKLEHWTLLSEFSQSFYLEIKHINLETTLQWMGWNKTKNLNYLHWNANLKMTPQDIILEDFFQRNLTNNESIDRLFSVF